MQANDPIPEQATPAVAARRSPQRRERRTAAVIVVLVPAVLTVGLVVVGLLTRSLWATQLDDAITIVDVASREHVRGPVAYDRVPPVGGDHASMWQRCGVYDVAILDERAVHSLERGAVWITYRPDESEDTVEVVEAYAQSPRVLVSPYPGLPAPVVVTVWGRQLRLDSANDRRLSAFLRRFQDGSTAPEGDAGCQDGTTQAAP